MGDNSTTSSSRPLTAAERNETYWAAMQNMARTDPRYNNGNNESWLFEPLQYEGQTYQEMGNGDYDRLEQNMYNSATAGLGRQEQLWRDQTDQSLADRGIWSSGVAQRAQGDVTERLAPQYAKAGADAALSRYQLQNANTQARNQFNQNEANQQWASRWRPLEYTSGLWNGTGGAISNSSGGGWSI